MTRGEVRWADLAAGRRPAVILTRDSLIGVLHELVVAPVASVIRGSSAEVVLGPTEGLARESAVQLNNITTIPKRRLGSVIARLSEASLDDICEALGYALGC